MKIRSVQLTRFKRFYDRTFPFVDKETGLVRDLVVLVGANGSGKSTILQAIAATLGCATGRLENAAELEWPGFNLELAGEAWSQPAEVRLDIEFSSEEIAATRRCWELIQKTADKPLEPPGDAQEVAISLRHGRVQADSSRAWYQFLGRSYASQVIRQLPEGYKIFEKLGTALWYTEQRTSTSLSSYAQAGKRIEFDLPLLRQRLSALAYFHREIESGKRSLRPHERDLFASLQEAYQTVFPGRKLSGPVPRSSMERIDEVLEEPWFKLFDGQREYDIEEMSGGERAVFPMLLDFVNWNIHHSVVLIDEVELHLHPPMQQALVRTLRKLSPTNQFILTTHSNAVIDILPEAAIIRVDE